MYKSFPNFKEGIDALTKASFSIAQTLLGFMPCDCHPERAEAARATLDEETVQKILRENSGYESPSGESYFDEDSENNCYEYRTCNGLCFGWMDYYDGEILFWVDHPREFHEKSKLMHALADAGFEFAFEELDPPIFFNWPTWPSAMKLVMKYWRALE